MHSIGIDCRFASGIGGLGTYTRGMVDALLKRHDPWLMTIFVGSREDHWVQSLPHSNKIFITEASFPHYSLSEQFRFPSIIRDSGCDLFYSPHFIVPLSCPVPSVITVHDLILHRYPNESGFLKRLAYRYVFDCAIASAATVVAVSASTKHDLLSVHPEAEHKVSVLHPGIDAGLAPATADDIANLREKYHLKRPFLLYVGNCKEHKNVPVLLEAFQKAQLDGVDLVLLCSGRECGSLRLPAGVMKIGSVESHEFSALYSAAFALVTATLSEGFGLPMAEAMACGCPVLATNCAAITEVCGGHALLVDPTVDALAEGMKKIVNDPTMRDEVRLNAALQWVKKYNWADAAAVLSMLFRKILTET